MRFFRSTKLYASGDSPVAGHIGTGIGSPVFSDNVVRCSRIFAVRQIPDGVNLVATTFRIVNQQARVPQV